MVGYAICKWAKGVEKYDGNCTSIDSTLDWEDVLLHTTTYVLLYSEAGNRRSTIGRPELQSSLELSMTRIPTKRKRIIFAEWPLPARNPRTFSTIWGESGSCQIFLHRSDARDSWMNGFHKWVHSGAVPIFLSAQSYATMIVSSWYNCNCWYRGSVMHLKPLIRSMYSWYSDSA